MDRTPVYRKAWSYATEHHEETQYRESRNANIACAKAIEDALGRYTYQIIGGNTIMVHNFRMLAQDVICQHGIERAAYVLAATIRAKYWGADIQQNNITWANTAGIPFDENGSGDDLNSAFVINNMRLDLINSFADEIRPIAKLADAHRNVAVYRYDFAHAQTNEQVSYYRESKMANIRCKEFIEQMIGQNYADNRLNTEVVFQMVDEVFGIRRMAYVLANTIQAKDHDLRFSTQNREWANRITIGQRDCEDRMKSDHYSFIVDKFHSGLTDLLATYVRKELVSAGIRLSEEA